MKTIELPVANLCKVKVLVDEEDYLALMSYNWQISVVGPNVRVYAIKSKRINGIIKNKTFYIHRIIMNCPKGKVVDHINGNCLDNRKQNLRICSQKNNIRNSTKRRTKTSSKYKGVYFNSSRNKWTSQICKDYKRVHVGDFNTEIEAANAYDKKALSLFGKYANLNFKGEK